MGGSSNVLAGCIPSFNFDLDMEDVHIPYLNFSYERIRGLYPDCTSRIRLFHGDLRSYVRAVLNEDECGKYVVHHDGSHEFNDVVRDMASLSFIKKRLCAIIAQDTHLRGTPSGLIGTDESDLGFSFGSCRATLRHAQGYQHRRHGFRQGSA